MRITILIIMSALILATVITSGCIIDKAIEKSPVLKVNLSFKGDYSNPVFDKTNVSRTVENVEFIKQPRYDIINNIPGVYCSMFYSQTRVSYETSLPYTGAGIYRFNVVFKDSVPIPKVNDTFVLMIQFIDDNGRNIKREYIGMTWPEPED